MPKPWEPLIFFCSYVVFASSRMLYKWNNAVCNLWRLGYFTWDPVKLLCVSISSPFMFLCSISLCGCTNPFVFPSPLKGFNKGEIAQVQKLEHILLLRATSLSHQVSGSAKKAFSLWCSGGPETAHLQVVYLTAALVASDTLCLPIPPGSSRCRALRIYLEVRIQLLMERARKEAYLIHPQWYC